MKKMILGALGALVLCVGAVPAIAAPARAAVYRADDVGAVVQTVQYRPYGYNVPPRSFHRPHHRFNRPPPRGVYGHRGVYRGPGPRPGFSRY